MSHVLSLLLVFMLKQNVICNAKIIHITLLQMIDGEVHKTNPLAPKVH